jgi:MFS transporter, ACS family, D-galactonate transporter
MSLPWLIFWFLWRPRRKPVASVKARRPLAEIVEVLKQGSAWGTCVGLFCANYFGYLLLTWLPYYLVHGRHFSLVLTAKVGGTAFMVKAASVIVSGRLSDFWISSGATPTLVRKTFLCIGSALGGTLLLFAGLGSDNACVILLVGASAALGLTTPHHFAASQTLAGQRMAGTWTGLQGFVGNLAGVVAPAVTGLIVDLTGQFLWAFIITAGIGWIGAASWLFLVGPVRQVAWTQLGTAESST